MGTKQGDEMASSPGRSRRNLCLEFYFGGGLVFCVYGDSISYTEPAREDYGLYVVVCLSFAPLLCLCSIVVSCVHVIMMVVMMMMVSCKPRLLLVCLLLLMQIHFL